MNGYSLGSIVAMLLLWELVVRWLEIPRYLLPTPTAIPSYMIAKFQLLASHTLRTLLEAGVGFIVGLLSAIVTAVLFFWFRPLKEMFYPYAVILNSTPIVAIAAPIVIIFGSGMSSKVVTAVYIMDTPRGFASIIACSLPGLFLVGVITLVGKKTMGWHISEEGKWFQIQNYELRVLNHELKSQSI